MTTPADLIAWLRQQLDDDAETFAALDSTALNGIDSTAGWDARAYIERIPAEVDAKRRILDEHNDPMSDGRTLRPGSPQLVCGTCLEFGLRDERQPWPCTTLRLLALPYADRPGYRDEWRLE